MNSCWKLLAVHDPTQVNRKGRTSARNTHRDFFHSPEQEAAAKKSRAALDTSGRLKRPIATEITPASTFWRAEEYHKISAKARRGFCHF